MPRLASHHRAAPPVDLEELGARAASLQGVPLELLASSFPAFATLGLDERSQLHTKGKVGELLERVLGASPSPGAVLDFPALGVELKTIPIDARGRPNESTFVCAFSVADADRAEWETSWTRQKLAHVLWVPIVTEPDGRRIVGRAIFWKPSAAQEAVLRADFEDVMGRIGIGDIESVTAHLGRWLQVRPKAANGAARTVAFGGEGERIDTIPRGFYLRARFTGALLRDPAAEPA